MVKSGLLFGLCMAAAPVEACRLALVLALDVSSSVDADEDRLQRGGLAAALLAPEVQEAFFASRDPVALQIFEWSGKYNQTDLLNWTLIRSPADLLLAAEALTGSTRSVSDMPTAMGYALGYASIKLRSAPPCLFQTIDMAGDGVNNDGFGPSSAYMAYPFDGVTVNGLAVAAADNTARDYYLAEVIYGPNAFLEVAYGFADFEDAMRRKLVRELSSQVIGRAQASAGVEG
ncbi:hypothetical protein AN191_07615 [Loktanella sp. 5RATIMAR09]|nr:hypothetical protein AN191_07615 [Loktanella sp. 5RATIMAR09]